MYWRLSLCRLEEDEFPERDMGTEHKARNWVCSSGDSPRTELAVVTESLPSSSDVTSCFVGLGQELQGQSEAEKWT